MDKGIQAEPESIKLLCRVEGVIYFKNEEPLQNEWFTGHPDIFIGENIQNAIEVSDIKTSWELDTFMPKLIEEADKGYTAQLNVYFDLTGAKSGAIVYALVSAPDIIIESEKYALLRRMNVISEESPEYLRAVEEMTKLMVFDDIDYRERIIKIPVQKDEELIQKMKDKVPILREWLKGFHAKHINQYPK